jgi:hypothetical protein
MARACASRYLAGKEKGPSDTERPKSREETPKLGSGCEEACLHNRTVTMVWFGRVRNLHEYILSVFGNRCI